MAPIPYSVRVQQHPGSLAQDIENEPDWGEGHQHRVGFKNRQDRRPGLTHDGDEEQEDFEDKAKNELAELNKRVKKGELISFRDVIENEEDYHLRRPRDHPAGWRYVLNASEDWIKQTQDWPANIEKRKKQHEQEHEQKQEQEQEQPRQEHEWKRETNVETNTKHHEAYATSEKQQESNGEEGRQVDEYQNLLKKYSPQEIALLRSLQHEKNYVKHIKQSDGHRKSPAADYKHLLSIDEKDQFSPDNWIPRSSKMIRLTGKHPFNAEPELTPLFDAGLVTPNEYHYVRNHGAVPHLLWETHTLEIEHGRLNLSMDSLRDNFTPINIQVAIACDGNRRKELNMIKRSKGFNWGSGAISCAFWKGPLLRDVLLAAGVPEDFEESRRYWVNFAGADDPSEGKYETCIPFQYAMDAQNDVILAQFMNDVPLPPDHGHPVRVVIPGYVGGRCVKWLQKIWISDRENESHYHIWDNRVLPSFITEKDGEFANAMFAHPSTACNEQNLNSVIVKPAQCEKIPITDARKGSTYRIEGYAYDGGGHEVQRVEVSLDSGNTWLYCIRNFPDTPLRHGNKFWTWLHWHVDIEIAHLLRCRDITVRCWNVFKNTQPERLTWNTMGMMNNAWYVVKPEIVEQGDDGVPEILFRHPTEPGTGDRGWMKPSVEQQVTDAKQAGNTPEKQFTREEIEKHDDEKSCWLVIDGKVYDATSVLGWHPGGAAAIIGHAGQVHQDTSDEFESIHDGFAYQKLSECILGTVTKKAAKFIEKNAAAKAKELADSSQTANGNLALQKHRWVPVHLKQRKELSKDTRSYTFDLPDGKKALGLGTCQHIQLGFHLKDRMLIRSYTPTRPVLQSEEDGTFELVVKTYFPDDNQPGGAMSNILDLMPIGEEIEIRGPTGEIEYSGNGKFMVEGKELSFQRITLILGGSGITPGYQLIVSILETEGDETQIAVIDANKSEKDILLKDELEELQNKHKEQFRLEHVLSHPSEEWKGKKGHINAEVIREVGFQPGEGSVAFLCGPPAMIQKAALPALRDWGYVEERDCFGF